LYTLRNPQQLVNNILPSGLSEQFAKISQITGFGFNGNMGFGFESVLKGLQGGVISSILSNFASQYSILTPLVGGISGQSNTGTPPSLIPSIVNPTQATAQGIVQPQAQPARPIPEGSSAGAFAGGPGGQPEVRRAFPVGTVPRAEPVNPNGSPAGRPAVAQTSRVQNGLNVTPNAGIANI
jgi:hypothetical protein